MLILTSELVCCSAQARLPTAQHQTLAAPRKGSGLANIPGDPRAWQRADSGFTAVACELRRHRAVSAVVSALLQVRCTVPSCLLLHLLLFMTKGAAAAAAW